MKKTFHLVVFLLLINATQAQDSARATNNYLNTADKLLASDGKLLIGGYGEVHYNQPLNSDTRKNGTLDAHRMVMLLGYNFNSRTRFISEIEFEHVSELFVEQAFLEHSLNSFINFRAGLMLIPMGIVNEYHEPTTFNGVERPLIDTKISPTTWREIGIGLTGNSIGASLKYQAYIVNGFNGYSNEANLNGKNGLRDGRQKGAESYISSPNFACKIEYYGIRSLNIGISGYFGNTQSTLYNGIDKSDNAAAEKADSSVTGVAMLGIDGRYNLGGLQMRGQFYYTALSNTNAYNHFTAQNGIQNDLGSAMLGYYLEAGYNVFKFSPSTKQELVPFIRVERCNTHYKTEGELASNEAYNIQLITTGLTYKLAKGAVLKADMQFSKPGGADEYAKVLNAGIGVMF